jgi:hypothetical protein
VHFGFLGHQLGQHTRESEGVLAERGAQQVVARGGRVPLVEDQVDDFEYGSEPGLALGPVRHLEGDLLRGECPFGAHDALGDGRLRDEVGAGDLDGGQPAEQPQGESDAGLGGQHGMAGGEDESQQVVVDVVGIGRFVDVAVPVRRGGLQVPPHLRQLARVPLASAYEIDRPVLGRGHEPRPGVVGHPLPGPLLQGGDQRVLRQLLRDPDVPHDARDTGDDAGRLDTEDGFDGAGWGGRGWGGGVR